MTTTQTPRDEVAELKARIKEQARQIQEKDKQIESMSPTVDMTHFIWNTVEDVRAYFERDGKDGAQRLRDIAESSLKELNRDRVKNGYERITYTDEEWDQAIDEALEDMLAGAKQGPPDEGPLARTLKLRHPNGNLVQIMFEGQVNNIAGSLNDGYYRYQQKGFKRPEPLFCPAMDCWEPAAMGTGKDKGKYAFSGYCSADHLARTERRDQGGSGITTRNEIVGLRG